MADFQERPPHPSRPATAKERRGSGKVGTPSQATLADTGHGPSAFLTGLDFDDDSYVYVSTPAPELPGLMSRQMPRPPLEKSCRIQMNQVCTADDIDDSPIHQRAPAWDFGKQSERPSLPSASGHPDPFKSVAMGNLEANVGVSFSLALPRDAPVENLGHWAPPAVLHPDNKRAPGGVVMDYSRAKDRAASRPLHVNDFDKELPRPAPGKPEAVFRDTEASFASLFYELTYDADQADRYVTTRRDRAPVLAKRVPRGRPAVQGVRALQDDVAVRRAVGLGCGPKSARDQVQKETTTTDLSHLSSGPTFAKQATEKVVGARRRPQSAGFKRPQSAGFRGSRISRTASWASPKSRTYEAIQGWDKARSEA
eukprot:TRINITY_DN52277_c0_g1_i1.p1 TRINITY_DN52277_c0_g1~~TRINITY_DN52277_c0_g1_i1.p1  ORF type:complete len:404 (-),score=50.42 TRINITY_DN52277_c0_g1_i1:93-1196(-)